VSKHGWTKILSGTPQGWGSKGLQNINTPEIHQGAVGEAGTCSPEPVPHSTSILRGG